MWFCVVWCALAGCGAGGVTVMGPLEPPGEGRVASKVRPGVEEARAVARGVWGRLDQSVNDCPEQFDYFPEGGIRIFACHVRSLEPYARLGELFGGAIFVSGPHELGVLVLDDPGSFGRYNPAFVEWLVEVAVPAAEDPGFAAQTRPTYERLVRPTAMIFEAVREKLAQDPGCAAAIQREYEGLLAQGSVPSSFYEPFFFFMNPEFCQNMDKGFDFFSGRGFDGGYEGNVVKSAVGFWVRRSLDGTGELFGRGLGRLLSAYEGGP
jgi:hypothetical protein